MNNQFIIYSQIAFINKQ